jgi:hypothetical protein
MAATLDWLVLDSRNGSVVVVGRFCWFLRHRVFVEG